jgi:phosphopantothenoylcysteine synthetase/decarboxylase
MSSDNTRIGSGEPQVEETVITDNLPKIATLSCDKPSDIALSAPELAQILSKLVQGSCGNLVGEVVGMAYQLRQEQPAMLTPGAQPRVVVDCILHMNWFDPNKPELVVVEDNGSGIGA